jgi:hypothetical protein
MSKQIIIKEIDIPACADGCCHKQVIEVKINGKLFNCDFDSPQIDVVRKIITEVVTVIDPEYKIVLQDE